MEEMTAYFDEHHLWIRELESYLASATPSRAESRTLKAELARV